MSAIYPLQIKFKSSSIVSGVVITTVSYPVKPLSLIRSKFTFVIVGYKKSHKLNVVDAIAIIEADDFVISDFITKNSQIEGYFTIDETDKDKQEQILKELAIGTDLPF